RRGGPHPTTARQHAAKPSYPSPTSGRRNWSRPLLLPFTGDGYGNLAPKRLSRSWMRARSLLRRDVVVQPRLVARREALGQRAVGDHHALLDKPLAVLPDQPVVLAAVLGDLRRGRGIGVEDAGP